MMFPTTAAGTGSGSDLPTSNLVTQDATVDCVSAWIPTNDCNLTLSWILFMGGFERKKSDDTLCPTMFCTLLIKTLLSII